MLSELDMLLGRSTLTRAPVTFLAIELLLQGITRRHSPGHRAGIRTELSGFELPAGLSFPLLVKKREPGNEQNLQSQKNKYFSHNLVRMKVEDLPNGTLNFAGVLHRWCGAGIVCVNRSASCNTGRQLPLIPGILLPRLVI